MLKLRLQVVVLVLLYSLSLASCSDGPQPVMVKPPAREASYEPIAAGPLMDEQIAFELAVYYLPQPTKDPLAELDVLLKGKDAFFRRIEKIEKQVASPTLAARLETDPKSVYAPPDLDSLQYFGRGLSREQAESLQQTESVLILDFSYSNLHVLDGLRTALELTHSLALATGGLLWDEATREVFSPETWEQRRITDWTEQVPDLSKHTVIHAYNKGEYVRAITLGMEKFGLPDVVADNFSWSLNRNVGHVVNLFAQAMVEGAVIKKPGEFDLDIRAIRNAKVREPQIATLKPNATGIALLSLRKGTWEEGDPSNRLIEITFDRGVGPDDHARREQIVSAAFGWEDSATRIGHNDELQEASRQARTRLPALRAEFKEGLAPGEFILVKAPFETPDGGHEWMWVEVASWKGDKITGLLKKEPINIPDLHGGQIVEVSEAQVFDYMWTHADGTTSGNETAKVIEELSPK